MRADVDLRDGRITLPESHFVAQPLSAWAASGTPVASRRDLKYDDFVGEFVRARQPVVVKGGVPSEAINPKTLTAASGDLPLTKLAGGGGSPFRVRGHKRAMEAFAELATLGDYLARFEADDDLPYLTNLSIAANFPTLASAFAAPVHLLPNWSTTWPFSVLGFASRNLNGAEVFIAPRGGTYGSLHYDRHELYVGSCQYYGQKTWWLCPPEQSHLLYPVATGYPHLSPVNPFNPDLSRFPLFALAKPLIATLEAGDVLFVPGSWWHATRAVTANVSTVHRVLNRHNLAAYLWDFKYYVRHEPKALLYWLGQLIVGR